MQRPLTAEQTRSVIHQKIREHKPACLDAKTVALLRGAMRGHLGDLFGDERKMILEYLFPESNGSTRDLTELQVFALLDWMGFKSEGFVDGKRIYSETAGTAFAKKEGANIIKQYQVEHGQQVLL